MCSWRLGALRLLLGQVVEHCLKFLGQGQWRVVRAIPAFALAAIAACCPPARVRWRGGLARLLLLLLPLQCGRLHCCCHP